MGASAVIMSSDELRVNSWGDLTHLSLGRRSGHGPANGHGLIERLLRLVGLSTRPSCSREDCPACSR
jgi:hypothetical protein